MDSEEAFIKYVNENPDYTYWDIWCAAIEYQKAHSEEESQLCWNSDETFEEWINK
jgi:hypothetical protein